MTPHQKSKDVIFKQLQAWDNADTPQALKDQLFKSIEIYIYSVASITSGAGPNPIPPNPTGAPSPGAGSTVSFNCPSCNHRVCGTFT
jgi:hypothetical protein